MTIRVVTRTIEQSGAAGRLADLRPQFLDDVGGRATPSGKTGMDKVIGSLGARIKPRAWHGEDLPAILLRQPGRDQRAGLAGCLDHDDAERLAGDNNEPGLPQFARELLGELQPQPRGVARTDQRHHRGRQCCKLATHGQQLRRGQACCQRHETDTGFAGLFDLALDIARRRQRDPSSCGAGEVRQSGECSACPAEAASGCGTCAGQRFRSGSGVASRSAAVRRAGCRIWARCSVSPSGRSCLRCRPATG